MRSTGAGGRRLAAAIVPAVALALAFGGCGGDDSGGGDRLSGASDEDRDQGGGPDAERPELPDEVVPVDTDPADVRALDNTFDAQAIRVAAGTTVRWTNRGRQDHDVVPAEGDAWGVEVEGFAPGAVYEHTFDQPGTYGYYCTIHGTATRGMVGAVVVD